MPRRSKDTISETQRLLAEFFGREKAFLAGRGATCLMLLFEALSKPAGRVILPAIACPSVLAAVLLTQRKPVIVDIDRNMNINPSDAEKVIESGDIVLGIHMFGIPFDVETLTEICAEKGAYLIEDAAQAVGGKIGGRLMGSFGVASVLSFASGKILPTHGGGAILTDDERLIEKLEKLIPELPDRPSDIASKTKALRDALTNKFNEAREGNFDSAAEWLDLYDQFGNIYKYRILDEEAQAIQPAIEKMESIVSSRRAKTAMYENYLEELDVWKLCYPEDCAPFRFSVILHRLTIEEVKECTEALRKAGLNASNLYIPLNYLAPEEVINSGTTRANFAGWHVINLWVDDTTDDESILTGCEILYEFAGSE